MKSIKIDLGETKKSQGTVTEKQGKRVIVALLKMANVGKPKSGTKETFPRVTICISQCIKQRQEGSLF